MSKFVLSLAGQSLVHVNQIQALPNVLLRLSSLSSHQRNHYFSSMTTTSLSSQQQQQQHGHQSSYIITHKPKIENNTSINKQSINIINQRGMYSDVSLGLDKLESIRESRLKLYETGKDRYIARLAGYLESGNTKSIFKDDLINLIALAENEQHLDLIEKIAIATKDENDTNSVGVWGSAVMRVYFKMNQLDRALKNLKDVDSFGEFFNQRTTYQIALTMLYNAGRYQDVVEVYELTTTRDYSKSVEKRFSTDRRLSIVAFAAYARINTPEAFEAAQKLYALDPLNPNFKMRALTFLAYLAVNHDKPTVALNLISDSPHKSYISARELKTISLIKLKRYEDILYHLRECIREVKRDYKIILQEVCELLKSKLDQIEDEQIRQELQNTLVELKDNDLIGDAKLDSIIFKEINLIRNNSLQQRTDFDGGRSASTRFNNYNSNNNYNNNRSMDNSNRSSFYNNNNQNRPYRGYNNDGGGFDRPKRDLDGFGEEGGRRGEGGFRQPKNQRYNNQGGNRFNESGGQNRGGRQAKSYFEDDVDDDLDEPDFQDDRRFK